MKNVFVALFVAALALVPLAGALHADGPSPSACPNTKATHVKAEVDWSRTVHRCGVGVSLFGLRLSVLGPLCPESKYYTPAHQECQGEKNEGTRCVPAGDLPITSEKCDCATATVLGLGFAVPICECVPAGNAGHVEDFKTEVC